MIKIYAWPQVSDASNTLKKRGAFHFQVKRRKVRNQYVFLKLGRITKEHLTVTYRIKSLMNNCFPGMRMIISLRFDISIPT